ncbi:hypothetical protein [Nonomuraea sp. B19D2]|uniref:Gp37-like protein n=1 Tax=Nonomuraea sp. B19D2 TaxID=3159561 RepID=UPI0032DA541B
MPRFFVEARDRSYKRVGVVEQYTSLDVISRFNAVGSWALSVPADSNEAAILQEGGGIIVWIDGVPTPVMSGPIRSINHTWSADQPGAGQVVYTGLSDETLLWSRVTLPVPTAEIDGQTADRYTAAGAAATVLGQLVNVNAGPLARADRVIPQLDVPYSALGDRVSITTRFDTLGVKLQEIAAAAGIGWRLRQGASDRLSFDAYRPVAHSSGQATFSPSAGNLAAYTYKLTAPSATRFILAAQGEGKDRWLREYDDAEARTVNNTHPAIQYTGGGWAHQNRQFGGDFWSDIHATSVLGESATYSFTGTGVEWLTERSQDGGDVDVYIDGVKAGTPNLFSVTVQRQYVGWSAQGLPLGVHEIKVVNRTAGKMLVVDAFRITGVPSVAEEWSNTPLERFADRRDIPVARGINGEPVNPEDGLGAAPDALSQLDQAADEVFAESAALGELSVTPIDSDNFRYGVHYEVGDIVTVEIHGGRTITDVLREVRLSDGSEGPRVTPLIGTDGASSTPTLYQEVRRIWNSIRKLEARR